MGCIGNCTCEGNITGVTWQVCAENCSYYMVDTCGSDSCQVHGANSVNAHRNCEYHVPAKCSLYRETVVRNTSDHSMDFIINKPIYASDVNSLKNKLAIEDNVWGLAGSAPPNVSIGEIIYATHRNSFATVLNNIKAKAGTERYYNESLHSLSDIQTNADTENVIKLEDWTILTNRLNTIINSCACFINCSCDWVCSTFRCCSCNAYSYWGTGYEAGSIISHLPGISCQADQSCGEHN